MRKSIVFLIFMLLSLSVVSCSLIDKLFKHGESVTKDETLPADYDPRFIKQILRVPAFPPLPNKPALDIFSIEPIESSGIRILLHLIDSTGVYLSGASDSTWLKYWCEIIEEFENKTYRITKFKVKEITERIIEPHAIALVLDHSGSIGKERALVIQNVAEQFITRKMPGDAISIIKYDEKVGVEVPMTQDINVLLANLQKNGLEGYGGGTAILNGIARGIEQLEYAKSYRRKTIIVITDGLENRSTIKKEVVVELAKKANITINTVGFGADIDENFLKEIAITTKGKYRRMYRTDEFNDVFRDIYLRLKNFYNLEYFPLYYGHHKVTIRFCLPNDSLIAEGFYINIPVEGEPTLLNVHFDSDSTTIKPEYMSAIENVFNLMKSNLSLKIEIRGHTDSTGDPDYNLELSQKRADAVSNVLIARGIAPQRIRSVGFGKNKPIADNRTEEGKAINRRTEFVFVSK